MYRVTIVDNAGIPRAWAEGETETELVDQAIQAASEYAVKRPDTTPLRARDYQKKLWVTGNKAKQK